MKSIFIISILLCSIAVCGQPIIDDFSQGSMSLQTHSSLSSEAQWFQSGSSRSLVGGNRSLKLKLSGNTDQQEVQVSVKNNKLIGSFGYNVRGVLFVNYGTSPKGNQPLNLNLSSYTNLKIEFEAKASKTNFHVGLFTNSDRAVWSQHVEKREGVITVTIPLKSLKVIGPNFTLKDVDYIRFQFNSASIIGNNFAVKKIWVD